MLDHRHDNVRVSYILPGSVDTGFVRAGLSDRSGDTGWMIAPEDVAEAVAWCCKCRPAPWLAGWRCGPRAAEIATEV